ncbi:MAG: pentapeptide repeat-containing protein, partial [Planctomycetaceae bacterium]|nr:pentapeptide repeat-containing protein [Planctomycetaceae bacterium]
MTDSIDAFISYRRGDGAEIARWLRDWLVRYRLPHKLREANPNRRSHKLMIWLDSVQKFASDDYFDSQIRPNVERARCLIVVSTPSVYEHREGADGKPEPNWVDREIEIFRGRGTDDASRTVFVIQAHPGEFPGPVPKGLSDLPFLSQLDLRAATGNSGTLKERIGVAFRRWLARGHLRDQLLDAVATLYEITPEEMTVLREEDTRRIRRLRVFWSVGVLVIAAALGWVYYKYVSVAYQERLANATSDWISDDAGRHTGALEWFAGQPDRDKMRRHWTTIASDQVGVTAADRGRAVQMIYNLANPPEYGQRSIAMWLRDTGDSGNSGLTDNTWHTAFVDAELSNLHLERSNLSRLAFSGSSFSGSKVSSSDCSACFFSAVDVDQADFRWTNFAKSNFIGVHGAGYFGGSRFHGVTFFGCDFTDASFERCDLSGASFLNCTLVRTQFTNAFLSCTQFEDCKLNETVFTDADVRVDGVWGQMAGVQLVDCTLTNVRFDGGHFLATAQTFYREVSPSTDDFNAMATIYPRTTENAQSRECPATLIVPTARFQGCELKNVSWIETKLSPEVFDEKTRQQLPPELREKLGPSVMNEQVRSAGMERSNWDLVEENLTLM